MSRCNYYDNICINYTEPNPLKEKYKVDIVQEYLSKKKIILKSYKNDNPGVYLITNTINGKIYIGSSSDVSCRWQMHKLDLNYNVHHSKLMQEEWKSFGGEQNFSFDVIHHASLDSTRNDLFLLEQLYLDQHNPEYNSLTKVAYAAKDYIPYESSVKKEENFKKYIKEKKAEKLEWRERWIEHPKVLLFKKEIIPLLQQNGIYCRITKNNIKQAIFLIRGKKRESTFQPWSGRYRHPHTQELKINNSWKGPKGLVAFFVKLLN